MIQNICPNAYRLVKESQNKQISSVNTTTINETIDEINKDYTKFFSLLENRKEERSWTPEQMVLYKKVERNKRAVLIYFNERLSKLEKVAWSYLKNPPSHTIQNFDEKDLLFHSEYVQNLENYSKGLLIDVDMDLTKLQSPPSDSVFVSVRAQESIKGFKISFDEETIDVEKGNSYLFKKSDIESYLRRGLFSLNE